MLHLLPPRLEAHHALLPSWFGNTCCSMVVSFLVCDGETVRLVHQAQEPEDSPVRIFPQETAKRLIDNTIRGTVYRGLQEELGLKDRDMRAVRVHPVELARFENHIPLDRTGGVPKTKCILYFAVQVPKWMEFVPNPREVREVMRATDTEYLQFALATRLRKSTAETEAVIAAVDAGLLKENNWEAFKPQLDQLRKSRAVH